MRFILVLFIFLTSCQFIEPQAVYEEDQLNAEHQSFVERRARLKQESEEHTLEEKAVFFENKIKKNMPLGLAMIPKYYGEKVGDELRVDLNCHLLAAMAFKYDVTKNKEDLEFVEKLFHSFIQVDEANGMDGYLPVKVRYNEERAEILNNECHENVYVQLFFAYQIVYDKVPSLRKDVTQHLEMIFRHFMKNDFTLYDQNNEEVPYSDLSPNAWQVYNNRRLSLISMLDLGRRCFGGDLRAELELVYLKVLNLSYPYFIQRQAYRSFGLEFPTHSSSWLNYIKLYNGYKASEEKYYLKTFENLEKFYKAQINPFGQLIGLEMGLYKQEDVDLIIKKNLESFPLDLRQYPSLGSIDTKSFRGSYVKLKSREESTTFVPVYARPFESIEWKHNQLRLDGNFHSKGEKCYTGVDYLILYWMWKSSQD
ncbi:hypothetical protein PQO03_03575 [Lentisphaera profundi]|uniref:D-glucuronyl C5-epimerase C-terminal domain-containing protein n=1 Tax=Lentisphaera profundi TaxID=1658616 RepID=A0ABY7VT06_9BACT|nr:hypothetical protein [Lentisphaera profundi]WDE97036.1 hypothetical protein PQO03_03575 [Lentisphaera profundi]